MSERADTDHVVNAVEMAVMTRGRAPMDDTIFHSDSDYADAPPGDLTLTAMDTREDRDARWLPGMLTRTSG